jgi:hypothetical protein
MQRYQIDNAVKTQYDSTEVQQLGSCGLAQEHL